jgi:hypothetical protein
MVGLLGGMGRGFGAVGHLTPRGVAIRPSDSGCLEHAYSGSQFKRIHPTWTGISLARLRKIVIVPA